MSKYSIYCIYSITCVLIQKRYIGQTNNALRRSEEHFAALADKNHQNRKLQFAYNVYGKQAFSFDILENSIPLKKINEREKYWIAFYNSGIKGFNLNVGNSTEKTLPQSSIKTIISIPDRTLNSSLLSIKELAGFRLIRAMGQSDFWCFIGKHLYHDNEGIVYWNSATKKMCCPECYHKLRED